MGAGLALRSKHPADDLNRDLLVARPANRWGVYFVSKFSKRQMAAEGDALCRTKFMNC